jgi:hypothetical protein
MNATRDAPTPTQEKLGREPLSEQLTWARAAYLDLHYRAAALEHLVGSTQLVDPIGDGPSTVLTIRVDRAAWTVAVAAARAVRPALPGTGAPA